MTGVGVADAALVNPVAGSVAFTLPKGAPAVGDLLLAFIGYNDTAWPGGAAGPVMPAGWTLYTKFDDSGANDALAIFYRWAAAGDAATFTFGSGGDYNSGVLLRVTGITTTNSFSVAVKSGGPNGSQVIITGAATPVVNGSLAVAAYSDDTGPGISTTTNGWTLYSATGTYHGTGVAVMNIPTASTLAEDCSFGTNANFGAYSAITLLLAPAVATGQTVTAEVTATDPVTGESVSSPATFTVGSTTPPPPPLSVTTINLPSGALTQAYSATLAATGGVAPYTWSAGTGLPAGVTLSAAGVLSGTPTASGNFSFTATVKDTKGTVATAPLSVTVSGAAIATLVYPNGSRYVSTVQDPKLSIKGESVLPYVDTNVWGATSGETMNLKVFSVRNWACTVTNTNPGGSVTCFPNTGAYPTSLPWQGGALSYLISGWDESLSKGSSIIASACYDNWFDNTLVGPQGAAVNEVMFHFDFSNRGAGPWVAEKVPFGGYTVNGVAIPLTYWNLAVPNGSTAAYWNLVDASGNITSLPKGSVDALAMFKWLVTNGYLSTTCKLTGFSLGFEICSTGGVAEQFTYNDMWWLGA